MKFVLSSLLYFITIVSNVDSTNEYHHYDDNDSHFRVIADTWTTPPDLTVDKSLGDLPSDNSSIRCADDPSRIYRWTNGQLRHYPNPIVASSWDKNWRELTTVDCLSLNLHMGPDMEQDFIPMEGSSISCSGDEANVYRLTNGLFRHYPNPSVASSWDKNWRENVVAVADCSFVQMSMGPPMEEKEPILEEGDTIMCNGDNTNVYHWTDGQLRHYPSPAVASSWNEEWRLHIRRLDCTPFSINFGNPMTYNQASSTIHYTGGATGVTRADYIDLQQKCILLTDTCSQMCRDWMDGGEAHNSRYNKDKGGPMYGGEFIWVPKNTCSSDEQTNNPVKWGDYFFQQTYLIWTLYEYGTDQYKIHIEPAAIIAFEKSKRDTAYLVFRGSQTAANFGIDAQYDQVPNPLDGKGGGTVMNGFAKYFEGLGINALGSRPGQGKLEVPGKTLYQSLQDISIHGGMGGKIKHLIVTGHSLGSTAATLSAAFASQTQWFDTVTSSVSASPRVGKSEFRTWYDSLPSSSYDPTLLQNRSWRLENLSDAVPKLPFLGVPVGNQVYFDEKYDGEARRHNPCCSYSYAINHPEMTRNLHNDTCTFPQ